METYNWPLVTEFLDRDQELARLEQWWASAERMPLNLYGRRRVGKSWLFRRFAHEKQAIILVADRLTTAVQLTRFAQTLATASGGITPELSDVATLFRTLYRLARNQRFLVVIDEFPWILGTTARDVEENLSSIQAVMEEERERSGIKLILCGSAVAQMESLQLQRNPLHGRLIPLEVRPLDRSRAGIFLSDHDPTDAFTRFAITGGMPRYLDAVRNGPLQDAVCDQVLRPDAPLWNEGRAIVSQELREPAVHFALLEQLAEGDKEISELGGALAMDSGRVSRYLSTLAALRLVVRRLPVGARATARSGHWALIDPFLRFWFRFVFPYQADLEAGLDPSALYGAEIAPALSDFVAPTFEDACREHARSTFGTVAPRIGRWWGNSRHDLRRTGDRSTEEVDLVGIARGRITLVGEAKWASRALSVAILRDLKEFKIPALEQGGFRMAAQPLTVLYSRTGYTHGLVVAAANDDRLVLVDVAEMLATVGR